jgi:glycosyltransferase involved in cell wall biosynthesis
MTTVSVIIPTYNRAGYVTEAIASALEQTHRPFEVIVVDDGSTDDTAAVLAGYGDPVRVIRQPNGGVGAARNTGVAHARGDCIAFLDSDDLWHPEKLARQVALLEADPELGLVHCGMETFDDATGAVLERNVDGGSGWVAAQMLRFDKLVIIAPGSSLMVPRRIFEEMGGFDVRLPPSEDWDLSFRIAVRYRVGFVPEPHVRYRQHPGGIHLNVARAERAMLLSFDKIFQTPDPAIQRLRSRAYGRIHRFAAGGYFAQRNFRSFLRSAAQSVVADPRNVGWFAAYPLRIAVRALRSRSGRKSVQ